MQSTLNPTCYLIWQAETTVINQCTQLLTPSADPSYVVTYLSHSFPQHRKYLCAGAWILMHGHPENINNANLVNSHSFYPILPMNILDLSSFSSWIPGKNVELPLCVRVWVSDECRDVSYEKFPQKKWQITYIQWLMSSSIKFSWSYSMGIHCRSFIVPFFSFLSLFHSMLVLSSWFIFKINVMVFALFFRCMLQFPGW